MPPMVAAQKTEPATNPRFGPFTWDDFVTLPDDDKRELFDGVLIEVDVPTYSHEAIVAMLIMFIGNWAMEHGGDVIASGYKVKVSPKRGVMPDVQYHRPGRPVSQQSMTEGAPDLGVEVISPTSGRHDRVTKLEYYRSIGMPEYWLVDPSEQSLHRFVLIDGSSYRVEAYEGDRNFSPDTFPGLEIPLAQLWAKTIEAKAEASAPADPQGFPPEG